MTKPISDYYSNAQIEWLITHEHIMRRIIEGGSVYCKLIRSNILKQHDAYNGNRLSSDGIRKQRPIKWESNDNFIR